MEQFSLSLTILPDGTLTSCVSSIPFIDGELRPDGVKSAIIGGHNSSEEAESRFLVAVRTALAEYRLAKGI
jgi:hypothetical protein